MLFPFNLCIIMYTVAEFSLSQSMYSVNEQEGGVSICVELLSGDLDRDVELELTFERGTAGPTDFNTNNVIYRFSHSEDIMVCRTVEIFGDGVVENRENFMASLETSSSDVSFLLRDAEVFIEDSQEDGRNIIIILQCT